MMRNIIRFFEFNLHVVKFSRSEIEKLIQFLFACNCKLITKKAWHLFGNNCNHVKRQTVSTPRAEESKSSGRGKRFILIISANVSRARKLSPPSLPLSLSRFYSIEKASQTEFPHCTNNSFVLSVTRALPARRSSQQNEHWLQKAKLIKPNFRCGGRAQWATSFQRILYPPVLS